MITDAELDAIACGCLHGDVPRLVAELRRARKCLKFYTSESETRGELTSQIMPDSIRAQAREVPDLVGDLSDAD